MSVICWSSGRRYVCCTAFPTTFFFNDTATTEIYTLSLHDALPILTSLPRVPLTMVQERADATPTSGARHLGVHGCARYARSEEHTSELQSRQYLVCRLLLEKKKSHSPRYLPLLGTTRFLYPSCSIL